jgi:hypothetical protein
MTMGLSHMVECGVATHNHGPGVRCLQGESIPARNTAMGENFTFLIIVWSEMLLIVESLEVRNIVSGKSYHPLWELAFTGVYTQSQDGYVSSSEGLLY